MRLKQRMRMSRPVSFPGVMAGVRSVGDSMRCQGMMVPK